MNIPRIIKLQYNAVLKSFLGNLKRREIKRNIEEVTKGAIMTHSMLRDINNMTNGVLFKKVFIKKISFPKIQNMV